MPPNTCECGGVIEYVPDALSHSCVSCGIMSDPTQYVLDEVDPWRVGTTYQGPPLPMPLETYGNGKQSLDKDMRWRRNAVSGCSRNDSLTTYLMRGVLSTVRSAGFHSLGAEPDWISAALRPRSRTFSTGNAANGLPLGEYGDANHWVLYLHRTPRSQPGSYVANSSSEFSA